MKLVIDIEANALINPTKVWVVVCRDLVTGFTNIFRNLVDDGSERERFINYINGAELLIGHNYLGYDGPVLERLIGYRLDVNRVLDTLIVSKLVDYPREGHSVEAYGEEFGLPKIGWYDYSKYSPELEEYCVRDVDITERIYRKYLRYINNPDHKQSIDLEHRFQLIVNSLEEKGFKLDTEKVSKLLSKVGNVLEALDKDITEAFPPRLKLIREITPKATKYGTISLTSIPKTMREMVSDLNVDAPFSYCTWHDFNPSSHKQIIEVLNEAGWKPIVKTKTHIETERDYNKAKRNKTNLVDLKNKLDILSVTGWKVNEENLATLPPSAPQPARMLAKRILYEARRRTLTEWINLVQEDGRVHGKFQALGAWTHRMAHQKPNMANVTNAVRVSDGKESLLGKELRQCWIAPKGRLLVGVDAEAIQLRVFAHLINDKALTDAIVNGDKKAGTDPHSLNKKYFGEYCKTRNAAKHSLYAMFFGGRAGKIAEIMDCSKDEAQEAIDRLTDKYPGLRRLQQEVFPQDARRGYFIGLDGRKVKIPGKTVKDREHLCMSGYLQNGEKVIMATATLDFNPKLKDYDSFLVDLVHDEWQNECPNDMQICIAVAELECQALVRAGVSLGLNCPIAGSYRNDHGDYTFGRNWYETH